MGPSVSGTHLLHALLYKNFVQTQATQREKDTLLHVFEQTRPDTGQS